MKKIAILGSEGCGKSTLALQLGHLLDIEVLHLSLVFWKPNWILTPQSEADKILADWLLKDSWIVEGEDSGTLDIRLAAADTIIFMDFHPIISFWRMLKRQLKYLGRSRPEMPSDGYPESLRLRKFKGVWTYPFLVRPLILQKIRLYSDGKKVLILRKQAEVRNLLEEIKRARNVAV